MTGAEGGSLQNVLSISTAANNRYLLHFNSLNSLTQWTAGIRLAMYEHATLQEAYTGSLIAGKGKLLNNIKTIMERSRFKTEDWARVRFGAGTPWRRCWCVISPPDEKEYEKFQKQQKQILKKKSAYDRKAEMPKGDIKFYDTRKVTKKTRPIATISDAYAAYAIYPQSKPLIDQSTLIKLEGLITIHTTPEATTEGFLFVMPEVHPAVTGFEMMLRWLFPVFDTFAMYGRPNRLIADTLDQRGLMFAMPRDRRYGYLDILDVSGLIHTEGSQSWTERQWRKELKKLTSYRMNSVESGSPGGRAGQRRNTVSRTSLNLNNRSTIKFDDSDSGADSSPVSRGQSPAPAHNAIIPPKRVGTAPVANASPGGHKRSASDAMGYKRYQAETPSRLSYGERPEDFELPPPPPAHGGAIGQQQAYGAPLERVESEPESPPPMNIQPAFEELNLQASQPPPTPVISPPAFLHNPNSRPAHQPYQAPELRRANSAMDAATLMQLSDATRQNPNPERGQETHANVRIDANHNRDGEPADAYSRNQGLVNISQRTRSASPTKQRLPTIPASPFVNDGAFAPLNPQDTAPPPPVPQHGHVPQLGGASHEPLLVVPAGSQERTRSISPAFSADGSNISRKPLPSRPLPADPLSEPSSPSSNGSLRNHLIDQEVLEQILEQSSARASTMASNVTEDSVDYASTKSARSASPKKSVERPRAGRLKTVGDPEFTRQETSERPKSRFDTYHTDNTPDGDAMPTVDFGPTYTYKPNLNRPPTSGTITPGGFGQESPLEEQHGHHRSASRLSPSDNKRNSYFGPPSSGGEAILSGQEKRRSLAWQPSAITPGGSKRASQTLTPEQWVQYRAALAASPMPPTQTRPFSPMQSHNRQPSGTTLPQRRSAGNTPPISRNPSGDWNQMAQRTPPSRSQSRNAGMLMNPSSPSGGLVHSTQSQHLSAREQMHVARATGSPLINVAGKDKQAEEAQAPGLVGALAAREREKQAIKDGMRSGLVQQAIAARQQQQAQAEMEAQYRQQQQHAQQQQQEVLKQQAYANFMNSQQSGTYQFNGIMSPGPQRMPQIFGQAVMPMMNQGAQMYTQSPQSYAQSSGWSNPASPYQATPQQAYGANYFAGQQQGQGQQHGQQYGQPYGQQRRY